MRRHRENRSGRRIDRIDGDDRVVALSEHVRRRNRVAVLHLAVGLRGGEADLASDRINRDPEVGRHCGFHVETPDDSDAFASWRELEVVIVGGTDEDGRGRRIGGQVDFGNGRSRIDGDDDFLEVRVAKPIRDLNRDAVVAGDDPRCVPLDRHCATFGWVGRDDHSSRRTTRGRRPQRPLDRRSAGGGCIVGPNLAGIDAVRWRRGDDGRPPRVGNRHDE